MKNYSGYVGKKCIITQAFIQIEFTVIDMKVNKDGVRLYIEGRHKGKRHRTWKSFLSLEFI